MRRFTCLVAVSTLVVVGASCSGDDGGDTSATTTEPPVATAAPDTTGVVDTTEAPTTTEVPVTTEAPTTTATPEPEAPTNYVEPGPFSVGVTTLDLGDRSTEVWYPVDPDDVSGVDTEIFDILGVFPESLQAFIPEELSGLIDTGAVRDAPVADDGPYPIVVYSHGFGGFRQVATAHVGHLASWGFVVLSTDHLERGLAAQATGQLGGGEPGQDVIDVTNSLDALAASDLGPVVDLDRVGITGHSAGAGTSLRAAVELEAVDAFVSISGGGTSDPGKPGLVVIAELDEVIPPAASEGLYDSIGSPRWLVNIALAGHNSFTDSCVGIRELGGLQSLVALLGEAQVARAEDGCTDAFVDPVLATTVLDHYSVAFFRYFLGVGDESDLALLGDDITGVVGGITLADLRADP